MRALILSALATAAIVYGMWLAFGQPEQDRVIDLNVGERVA